MRAGNLDEAVALLTTALNTCGPLRLQGAVLLAQLLHLRADVHERKRDSPAAAADRDRADNLRCSMLTGAFGVTAHCPGPWGGLSCALAASCTRNESVSLACRDGRLRR